MKATAPCVVPHREQNGFTLIELVMTVGVLAVLMTIGASFFKEAVMNSRMIGTANDLMADLNIARSEASRRRVRAYLCTSTNGTTCTNSTWNRGWIIFLDLNNDGIQNSASETALKAHDAINAAQSLTAAGDLAGADGSRQVLYHPSGAANVGGAQISFILCDDRNTANTTYGATGADNKGRTILVGPTGRVVVNRRTCATATS